MPEQVIDKIQWDLHSLRGFGFVIFDEPEVLDSLLEQKHTLDGREVCFALKQEFKDVFQCFTITLLQCTV